MPSAKSLESTRAPAAARDQSVASASMMGPAVHFLTVLLAPGALGATCPSNYYYSLVSGTYVLDLCYECSGNTSASGTATSCTQCPLGKWVQPQVGSRRRWVCSRSDCASPRRRDHCSSFYGICGATDRRTGCVPLTCPEGQVPQNYACVTCPEGHRIKNYTCVPMLPYALEHVPAPKFQAQPDSYGFVSIRVDYFWVTAIYENISVEISLDMVPNASALRPKNSCDADGSNQWTRANLTSTSRNYTAHSVTRGFTYPELDGPCALGTAFNGTGGTRSGIVALFYTRKLASGAFQALWGLEVAEVLC